MIDFFLSFQMSRLNARHKWQKRVNYSADLNPTFPTSMAPSMVQTANMVQPGSIPANMVQAVSMGANMVQTGHVLGNTPVFVNAAQYTVVPTSNMGQIMAAPHLISPPTPSANHVTPNIPIGPETITVQINSPSESDGNPEPPQQTPPEEKDPDTNTAEVVASIKVEPNWNT